MAWLLINLAVLALAFLKLIPVHGAVEAPSEMLPIKELVEPRNFPPAYQQNPLLPAKRVAAKPAKGPEHLVRGLSGRCYTTVSGHYEYQLCPFDNATQRDVSFQMLAIFHGVIGVYNGWYMNSNASQFAAMSMPDGDPCPVKVNTYRRSIVQLTCANVTSLLAVHEAPVCQYNMLFGSPLVCHPQAMLVYPCLASDHAKAWNLILTLRDTGVINESGYNLLLDNLLYRAQLLADTRTEAAAAAAAARNATEPSDLPSHQLVDTSAVASTAASNPSKPSADNQRQSRLSLDFVYQQINLLQKQVELHQAAQSHLDAVAPVVPKGRR